MTSQGIIRTYLGIAASTTLAQSLIWGVNTLFLLSVGLDIYQVMLVNAAYTVSQAFFEVPTGVVADTVGVANPAQVRRLLRRMVAIADGRPVICHFHDTRGLGLANVVAALDAGVRIFDAALAGLGGCPFAPGASGNIDTEDTAYLLEAEGFATGIDIEALIALRREVEGWLPGERFAGAIARAGVPSWFRPAAAI